jgi:(R,R)-butanediol dehydrogenase/meso-butanediol dehydrogenase/diacetyl reductase
MKAAVYKGKQRLVVEEVPTPSPGPGQVLVKVRYCAVCGSDVHRFQHDMLKPGAILGHEYSGVITAVGEGVEEWKVGDRVVGGGGTPPPDAPSRLSDSPRYTARTVGFSPISFWGGYAEYVLLDAWRPLPMPDTVTDETAALTEPCAIAVHGVRLSKLKVGDKAAIIGAGPIGLLTLQTVKAAGAREVYVSEPSPARREAAKQLGADHVLDPINEDIVAKLVEQTDGLGPDVVFECAGARNTLQQSLEMVRRSGQVLVVSLAWEDDPVLTVEWVGREVEMKTAYGSEPRDWQISLDLMEQGKVQAGPMVPADSYVPLDEIQEAFESLLQPDAAVQLLIVP